VYRASPAFWARDNSPEGFAWIDANDAHRNVFSFVRRAPDTPDVVCVTNFASIPHDDYRLGLPGTGEWEEILNTDAAVYGGSGVGNLGSVTGVAADPAHSEAPGGSPAYADIVVPPLSTVWFRRVDG
jgi:1,4-alpha-glucan branching enzyme